MIDEHYATDKILMPYSPNPRLKNPAYTPAHGFHCDSQAPTSIEVVSFCAHNSKASVTVLYHVGSICTLAPFVIVL